MLMTKRKPATIGEILVEEFMKPIDLTQGALAEAMGCNASTSMSCATIVVTRPWRRRSPAYSATVRPDAKSSLSHHLEAGGVARAETQL